MRKVIWIAPVVGLALAAGTVVAQVLTSTAEGSPVQIFTMSSDDAIAYTNPSGAQEDMPGVALTFDTKGQSLVTVTFSARGTVQPSSTQTIPIGFIGATLDGVPLLPGGVNPVEFLYPQFCCDTRSFTWIASGIGKGTHTVQMRWGMGNPTQLVLSSRTLTVDVARQ